MENSKLIYLINHHQKEGFDVMYNQYSEQVYKYILKIVGNRDAAYDLLKETFTKIKFDTPVLNYNTPNVFAWLIEETIQVIMENCPEKHGEIRENIVKQTQKLNIIESYSSQHAIYLRKSA